MKYFRYLPQEDLNRLFFRSPEAFSKVTPRDTLRCAVGGLLYIPATHPQIADILLDGKVRGLTSMAVCLEDAVGDDERVSALNNATAQFARLSAALADGSLSKESLPLLFVRVKDNDMLAQMTDFFVRYSDVITGVILPKANSVTLERGLALTAEIGDRASQPFYAMPILESDELMLCPDRMANLRRLMEITECHFQRILNIRVGATDLCGLYGIRRGVDTSIYSVGVTASCISDVVRVFGLRDRYTVSGPVWEYYNTPAEDAPGEPPETAGLLREVGLDLQNGVLGKTCVHPHQLLPVQVSYVVPFEQYQDALGIVGGDQRHSGVLASGNRNKMNELKPHALWAEKILRRGAIYGVCGEQVSCAELLRAVSDEAAL